MVRVWVKISRDFAREHRRLHPHSGIVAKSQAWQDMPGRMGGVGETWEASRKGMKGGRSSCAITAVASAADLPSTHIRYPARTRR